MSRLSCVSRLAIRADYSDVLASKSTRAEELNAA